MKQLAMPIDGLGLRNGHGCMGSKIARCVRALAGGTGCRPVAGL